MSKQNSFYIPEKSQWTVIAAALALFSLIFTWINWWGGFTSPIEYVPLICGALFAVFSLILAKKHLALLILPAAVGAGIFGFFESPLYWVLLYGLEDFTSNWQFYDIYGKLLAFFMPLAMLTATALFALTLINRLKTALPAIVGLAATIFFLFCEQVYLYVSFEEVYFPFYTIAIAFFFGAMLVIAATVTNKTARKSEG